MTDAYLTAVEMDARVPADHPLRLLGKVASDPLERTVARLAAMDQSAGRLALQRALKAALLQAFYAIPDQRAFADHVRFNSLFRWFVGLSDIDEDWDSDLYARLYDQWINDRELRQFMNLVISDARQSRDTEVQSIADALESWLNRHCPRSIYFHQFANSPIKEVMVALRFANPNGSEAPSIMTDALRHQLRSVFPADVDPADEDPIAANFWQFDTQDGFHRVIVDTDALYLSSTPPQFQNWEDSLKPYLAAAIEARKAANAKAFAVSAVLAFNNVINLPAEAELSHYFHMLPERPPNVVPPRHMREQNLAYSFPARVMKGCYSTDLLYETGSQFLRTNCEIQPTDKGVEVQLSLEAHWHEPFVIGEGMAVIDGLKNNLYVAFHSLITDRTRSLFQ